MKTEIEDDYTWEDVIFENRNRNYGAYLVRRSYSRNATIAFGASVSFAVLLLFLPQIISALTGGKVVVPDIIVCEFPIIKPMPLPPIDLNVVETPPPTTNSIAKELAPIPVTKEVETVIPTVSQQLAITTPIDGNGVYTEPLSNGNRIEELTFVVPSGPINFAEVMPEYEGGQQAMMKFISKNCKYPKSASSMGIEGTVYVSFVINADGDVTDVKIVKGISADCDKEAVRVISKMSEWNPGMMNQMSVAVRMVLPIKFQINQ